MKKRLLLALVFLITVSLNIGSAPAVIGAEAKIVLTWADYASPGFDQLNYVNHYIKRISEETKGRVQIKLYPAEQLVKAIQQYEALMQGTIDMSNLTPVYYGGKIPLLLLANESSNWEPGDSVTIASRLVKEESAILAKDGIKFMGWTTELPPMCVVGPKIFKSPSDFKGVKLRAPGTSTRFINKWGGTGVAIPASDTYMAISNGVVDGAWTTIGSVEGARLYEVCPAITVTRTGGTAQIIGMNMKKWESLPADIKKSFEKVNREMVPWAYNHAINYANATKNMLKTKFKIYHQHTLEEQKVLDEVTAGVFSKPVIKKLGEPAQKMWDKILLIAKENKEARKQGKLPRFFED
jgi:TRAP-type C4-dicarboxylate transport system substrate-binding protein